MSIRAPCGQLTRVWFVHNGWRRPTHGRSLAQSVRWTARRRAPAQRIVSLPRTSGDRREAYLPAQQPPPSPQARVPCAHEHPRRSRRVEVPACQGPRSTVRLIDRVRERDAFVRLRRDGMRVRADPLWCSFVLDPDLVPPKVAFAIGRAVGPAVRRNRLRRRLRALLADSDVPPGLYLFGARVPACEQTFDDVSTAVSSLLVKVHARVGTTSS